MLHVEKNGRKICLEAVIFDMDGLMFDSERVVMHSWDVAGEKLGYGPLGHNIYHTLGMGAALREQYFRNTYGETFPYEQFREIYREAYYAYADQYGVPVKEGLLELLQLLKELKISAAMATSTASWDALKRLRKERLEEYFQAIITGDMVTETKPSPEIYEKACKALEVEPTHAIALEDAWNGILSAHRAGMHPIMIPDMQKDSGPVEQYLLAKMDSLCEVADWLRKEAENKNSKCAD